MSVDKSSVLKKLRESDAIYVLMSDCTIMPFVVCDPETYDDEVFIFFSEEDAMRGGQEFLKANNPLKIFNIETHIFGRINLFNRDGHTGSRCRCKCSIGFHKISTIKFHSFPHSLLNVLEYTKEYVFLNYLFFI